MNERAVYETTIDHVSDEDYILYYTSEKKYYGRLRKLINAYPDDVTVKVDDGQTLGVKMPATWFRAPCPPRKGVSMSEERKKEQRERMLELRAAGKIR